MAQAANPDSVNKDQENVDYVGAVELILTTIHGLESEQRSLSKDAQEAWGRIEDMGVNKEGAKLFSKILKKPVEKRQDEFRTFVNLAKAAGWFDWLNDLVDRAQTGIVGSSAPAAKAPQAPKAPTPVPAPAAPEPPADSRDLSNAAVPERVNLTKGWIQRLKADTPVDADMADYDFWVDVRQETPQELAAERERRADFPIDGPQADVEAAKTEVADKVKAAGRGGRDTLKIVSGGKAGK